LFLLLLSTMMLPDIGLLIPRFIMFRTIGWVDTLLSLIVPSFFGGGAYNIFLTRQFFLTIPHDFDVVAEALRSEMAALRPGNGMDPQTALGPLISAAHRVVLVVRKPQTLRTIACLCSAW
jgi:hypothetical protein